MAIYGYIKIARYFSFFPCVFHQRFPSEKASHFSFIRATKISFPLYKPWGV